MIRIKEAVIVEGKYDKIKLSSLIDGLILETDGFAIFKNKDRLRLFRRLAETRGLLILTDSDGAGFVIRRYLGGSIPTKYVKHAYIPDLLGKESRKAHPSKEGKLGVEGVPKQVILDALKRAGATFEEKDEAPQTQGEPITPADLYEDGITGRADSKRRRGLLLKALDLPEHLSSGALLQVLNTVCTKEEYRAAVAALITEETRSGIKV